MNVNEILEVLEIAKNFVVSDDKSLGRARKYLEPIENILPELLKEPVKNSKLIGYVNITKNFFDKAIGKYADSVKAKNDKSKKLEEKREENRQRAIARAKEISASQQKAREAQIKARIEEEAKKQEAVKSVLKEGEQKK